jgi:catechol 2,3-dioxygenase-like lactoylglutathione lyase family enzyme
MRLEQARAPQARRVPRPFRSVLALLLVTLPLLGSGTARAAGPVSAVDSVAITVSDTDRAVDFYSRVLTFEKVADREVAGEEYEHLYGVFGARIRAVRMRLGDEYIELLQFLAPRGRPIAVDSHSNDRWFQHIAIIVRDMGAAYDRLRSFHVEHGSSGPQRLPDWNPHAGGIEAFYFRDPDGHNLEVLAFPPDKGLSKWHVPGEALFLGIDHTAIVVADTQASLHFYHDTLGLQIVGASENYGTEQEHLNNVFGARLRITSLRAAQGPGVELLEYQTPRTGRAMPADTQANDLWYWQIDMRAPQPAAIAASLEETHAVVVSPPAAELHDGALGWRNVVLARDPDGHAVLVAAEPAPADARRAR